MTKRAVTWGIGLLLSGFSISIAATPDQRALHLPVWKVGRSSDASITVTAGFLSAKGKFLRLFDEESATSNLSSGYWIEVRKWRLLLKTFPEAESVFVLGEDRGEICGIEVGRIAARKRDQTSEGAPQVIFSRRTR